MPEISSSLSHWKALPSRGELELNAYQHQVGFKEDTTVQKSCGGCGLSKPYSDFYHKTGTRGKQYAQSDAGYSSKCRECDKKARKLYIINNPDKAKESDRGYHLSRYGLDVADYNSLFAEQSGKCLGCSRHQVELKKRLCVDHSHVTGDVRGLLCHSCNSLLGMAKDSVEVLSNLIKYLNKFSESAANERNTDTKVG